jgi:flagellar hook-associated protein 1 FlgK
MNEEMSDVIRFQQGFQANARIISVVSEMLDTLINRTGV